MSIVTTVKESMLNHLTGRGTWTSPAPLYAAASTSTPSTAGTNVTEPTGNNYARVQVPSTSFADASTTGTITSCTTSADFSFPAASGTWGTITHIVMYDALTAGNPIAFGALASSQLIESPDVLTVTAGGLTFQLIDQ